MKRISLIVTVTLLATFTACDKVKNPIQNPNALANCTLSPHIVKTDSNTTKINHRIVMVQDYTGHTCGNCPRAAENAETIQNKYGDSVVVFAVHAGTQFAPPKLPDFPEDFRTPAGTDWDNTFGFSAAGLPKGTVNWAQTPFPQPRTVWDGLVNTALDAPQSVKLALTTTLDSTAMLMKVEVRTTFLQAHSNTTKLIVVVLEDSIIARQKDYSPPVGATVENGDEIPDYVFMHVLRGSLNGSWGEELVNGAAAAGSTIRKTYNCCAVTPWNNEKKRLKNLSVAAIVYDDATKQVLQVDKLKLK